MNIRQMLLDPSKYVIKSPYSMTPTRLVVHNTYNDASANNEISYMIRNNNQVSFHIAVDDVEAVQGIPFNRNAWHTGDGANGVGNRQGIGIEICYSKSGGERFMKAEQNAAKLVAKLLKEYGWGMEQVTKHQDYSNSYCPHRTLDMGWERFLNMVRIEFESPVLSDTSSHSIETIAREVIAGKWGNGEERKSRLVAAGYNYDFVQQRVNDILMQEQGVKPQQKPIDTLAREVIHGDWGNGSDRQNRLTASGYDYHAVQARVNELLK